MVHRGRWRGIATAALLVTIVPSMLLAEPYWIAYEGNEYPEDVGWRRHYGNENVTATRTDRTRAGRYAVSKMESSRSTPCAMTRYSTSTKSNVRSTQGQVRCSSRSGVFW